MGFYGLSAEKKTLTWLVSGEFKCRGETVKPGTRKFTVPLDPTKTSVEFEACLLDNGLYDIEIKLMDEEGNAVKITKVLGMHALH